MTKYILAIIIIFFLVTRLLFITDIPKSLYWDEVSIGYNAYSILKTGSDEWGKFMPLHFRAFGEFKLPVYIYTVSIFQSILGLGELSVRLPAVMFSLLAIIATYFITCYLFKNKLAGLLAAFLMTISPWLFIFSRSGYEATAGLAFYLFGLIAFLLSPKKPILLIISALCFSVALYSYNSYRIIVPISLPILLYFHKGNYSFSTLKYLIISAVILAIFFLPIIRLNTSQDGGMRYQAVGIDLQQPLPNIILNTSLNYFKVLSPQFLFISGDSNLRSQQPGFGQLYFIDLVFLITGFYFLTKKISKNSVLIIILFLISIIPSAITKESPHALRSINVVPFYSIIAAFGVYEFSKLVKLKAVLFLIVLLYLVLFCNYFYSFIFSYPLISSTAWQYPYKAINIDYSHDFQSADKIWITDKYAQPYIYTLFYQAIDPLDIKSRLKLNNPDKWGMSKVSSFDKFNFGLPVSTDLERNKNILIFTSPEEKLSIEPFAKIGEDINVYKKE